MTLAQLPDLRDAATLGTTLRVIADGLVARAEELPRESNAGRLLPHPSNRPPRETVIRIAERSAVAVGAKLADVLGSTTAQLPYQARRIAWRAIVAETGCSRRNLASVWGCDRRSVDRGMRGSS